MPYCVHIAWEQGLVSQVTCAGSSPIIHQPTAQVLSHIFGFPVSKWLTTLRFCSILKTEEDIDEGPGVVLARRQGPARDRCLLSLPQMFCFSEYSTEPGHAGQIVDKV